MQPSKENIFIPGVFQRHCELLQGVPSGLASWTGLVGLPESLHGPAMVDFAGAVQLWKALHQSLMIRRRKDLESLN